MHGVTLNDLSRTNKPTRVSLVALYELGRQPFGVASPAAWLREAGAEVVTIDLSRQSFDIDAFDSDVVAFHLPMHTATRLAIPVIRRVRALVPRATLCGYGLYAALNESVLQGLGVKHIFGGEFEEALVELVSGGSGRPPVTSDPRRTPRLRFRVPDRAGLPALERYATLQMSSSDRRVVGYTESSRGCKHLCRHCPVVPIYEGQFRVVPREVVLADIRAQVEAGARHITFGDPDFFNGVGHAVEIAKALRDEFPGLTYDVTIKIEHLLQHDDKLGLLRDTGCVFVVSAVESIDDVVLARLQKGHKRTDFEQVVKRCREVGLVLTPTFIPFTPWTTLAGYHELLRTIDRLQLVEQVAPVQLTLRLLVPERSRLLELDARKLGVTLGPFDAERLVYPWRHVDTQVDVLQEMATDVVARHLEAPRTAVFDELWRLSAVQVGDSGRPRTARSSNRATVPYLNEPWYC